MSSKDETLDILKAENYLLGTLTDDEALDFECEVFPDENLSEQLDFVRNDLSEKYIRSELDEKQKIQFENYFLSFPYNAEIFDFQKSLIEEFGRREIETEIETEIIPAEVQTKEKPGILAWLSEIFTTKMLAVPAFAALLLAIFGGIFLYNSRKGVEIVTTISPTPTPVGETTPEQSSTPNILPPGNTNLLSNQNQKNDNRSTEENNQNKAVELPTPATRYDVPQSRSPVVATVTLFGKFRPGDSIEKPIIVGKETEKVNLEFQYPEEDAEKPFKNYKMILEPVGGNIIWEENLAKDGKKTGDKLLEDIPPKRLQTGQYRFRLIGVFQNNNEETVQSQTFFVKRIS